MAQFENISHGEPNWEGKVNRNFSNVTQDSGWQALPVLAPATSTYGLRFKILNQILYFDGSFVPNNTGEIKIATLPLQINKSFLGKNATSGAAVSCLISRDGSFSVKSLDSDQSITFDGVSLLVGNITLGGVTTTLYQRFRDFFGCHFNTKSEVA